MSTPSAKGSSDLLVDVLHPAAPPLPPPLANEDLHWLAIARHYASMSVDPLNRSGCVITRASRLLTAACDSFPGAMRSTMARRRNRPVRSGLLLSAEQAAVALAAISGVSLHNSCAYVWPTFTDARSAALLVEAGCVVISVPDFQIPARLESDMQLIRELTAETGVLLRLLDAAPLNEGSRG
jgi:deoxycytidylate deaminase